MLVPLTFTGPFPAVGNQPKENTGRTVAYEALEQSVTLRFGDGNFARTLQR